MTRPLIFDINRASTADGPGLRTTVFFKGCNLDCFWCHNPEGKSPNKKTAFFEEKCTGCGTCKKLEGICPHSARKSYGKEYSEKKLFDIIAADKRYYDATGGGVTFSGGECMLYPDFVASLSKLCKENGISVAVDTAGSVPFSSFQKVLPYVDLFLYDIKCLDRDLHKKGTGVDNSLILENLEKLIKSGKKIIIRTPVIPSFNDTDELYKIKSFCKQKNLTLELLPYHNLGDYKKKSLINKS